MLRGNCPTKLDEKGRLKIPTLFRSPIEQNHGVEFYVTSLYGDSVRVYPLPVWSEIEQKLAKLPSANLAVKRFLRNTNYYGQAVTMDNQGRILIPAMLREVAQIKDDVAVMGNLTYLEVWNTDVFRRKLQEDPLTEADEQTLADLGV
ncbi:MAG: division/cell wall cluster transcriptional repressor MraZ [Acidobacteriota bacterium]